MHETIAHVYKNSKGEIITQSLKEHSKNVAKISSNLAKYANLSAVSYLIGRFHDCGKSKSDFQKYIQGKVKRSDGHANPGGRAVAEMINECCNCRDHDEESILKEIVSLVISSHHTGLKDWCLSIFEKDVPDKEILRYLNDNKNEFFDLVLNGVTEFKECCVDVMKKIKVLHDISRDKQSPNQLKCLVKFIFGGYARFLLSCQIDADWYDTYLFLNSDKFLERNDNISWNEIQDVFEFNLSKLSSDSDINSMRKRISQIVYNKGKTTLGCFSLSVPTGGGKTLASFRFALEHAKVNQLERIIFVIPFCSIIEQTASVIREFLNHSFDNYILEDHSQEYMRSEINSNYDDYSYKILSDRWDCKIIITTAVQYLNIFFLNVNRYTRKLNKLSSAIVIFDEVQAIPKRCRQLFNMSVNFLTLSLGSSALICSATIPEKCKDIIEISHITDLCSNSGLNLDDQDIFDRVRIINDLGNTGRGGCRTSRYISELAISCMTRFGNCLIIANSKKQVREIHDNISEQMNCRSEICSDLFFLSTDLCPKHRLDILSTVNKDLKSGKPVILVSTQLIEAGVDIDFNSVVRVVAGADSIIQAAGRCNRNGYLKNSNGEKIHGVVYIVDYINQYKELSNLEEIIQGITISEKILRCDEFSKYVDLNEFLNRYYSEYNLVYSNCYLYHYNDNAKGTIDHLLTEENGGNYLDVRFKMAGEKFKVIDDNGKYSLFVEYDDNSSKLFDMFNEAFRVRNFSKVKNLRRLLSLYEISVSKKVYDTVTVKDGYGCYKLIDTIMYKNILKGI